MKKQTRKTQQRENSEVTGKRRISQGKTYAATGSMPDWMRQFLAAAGINREFDPANLSPTQCFAIEHAEKLCNAERLGLARVTFDPEEDSEPRVELTEHGKERLQGNEFW